MRALVVTMVLFAACAAATAQEQPVVRVKVTPETVAVGEPAELTVTVLVPTWFTRPPIYPTFELSNAMTRMPPDSSYPIRERVGNESWSGIVRSYEIYPLLGATYRMAGQSIVITYANPGADPLTANVELPEVVFRGAVPAGAESLDPYIAGDSLELSVEVEGELDDLAAGDAIVITFTAELSGLPAIFLPPLAPDLELDGVSIYADAPELEDGASARRSEKLTLVFDAGGDFVIPGLELRYWNTASESIETAFAAGPSIAVDGPPPISPEEDVGSERRWPQAVALLVITFVMLLVLRRWAPTAVRYVRDAAARRRQTERYAFTQLERAIASQRPEAAYHALLAWLERLQPGTNARSFAHDHGDASLLAAVDALSARVYNDAAAAERIDLKPLRAGLASARKRVLQQRSLPERRSLPPLNP